MKQVSHILIGLLVSTTLLIYGCTSPEDANPSPAGTTGARFPCLIYYQDSIIAHWNNYASYKRFVFNAFDSSATKPWQLIAYGRNRKSDTIHFNRLSDPFPIFNGQIIDSSQPRSSMPIDTPNIAISNLEIKGKLFDSLVVDKKRGANALLFIPYFKVDTPAVVAPLRPVLHLRYYVLLVKYDKSANKSTVISFDPSYSQDVINDVGGIDLNPCPPAHMDDK